jgi:hypothetical protein
MERDRECLPDLPSTTGCRDQPTRAIHIVDREPISFKESPNLINVAR